MTIALSSRLTCVRARGAPLGIALAVCRRGQRIRMRLPRRQTVGRPQSQKLGEVRAAQSQRWPGGPSRCATATALRSRASPCCRLDEGHLSRLSIGKRNAS